MVSSPITFAAFCSAIKGKGAFVLCLALCMLGLGSTASAQKPRIVSFDAPGADLNPGDYNGTYPSGINAWGVIAGSYQSADTVFHGFLRSPRGEFITFQAPGADTTAGSYNGTYPHSINDLGAITGNYWDATASVTAFSGVLTESLRPSTFQAWADTAQLQVAFNLEGAVVGYSMDSNYSSTLSCALPTASLRHGLVQTRARATVRKDVIGRELPT